MHASPVLAAAVVVAAAAAALVAPAAAAGPTLWVGPHAIDSHVAADPQLEMIAKQSEFMWVTSDTGTRSKVSGWETSAAGRTVPLVLYDIPQRDLGSYSKGGAPSEAAYATFVANVAAGIGANRAIVVLEPDALGQIGQLSAADQATRYRELGGAVATLKKSNTHTTILIDASAWIATGTLAADLKRAGVAAADGFVLNTANFNTTASMEAKGDAVLLALAKLGPTGGKYAIDTSRNGQGPYTAGTDGQNWCNPPGRGLGHAPAFAPDAAHPALYADLWVKTPGESDGTCKGGPAAGQLWLSYADGLVQRAAPSAGTSAPPSPTPTAAPTASAGPRPSPIGSTDPAGLAYTSLTATVSGTSVTASTVVTRSTALEVPRYGISVRSASGADVDFTKLSDVWITPAGTSFRSTKTFAPGTYTYEPTVKIGTTWHQLSPVRSFTVAAAGSDRATRP